MKKIFLCLILAFVCATSKAQVVLNEVMSSNDAVNPDFQGQFVDWVELYNTSNQPVDISGYYLSDNAALPYSWSFTSAIVPAKGYLIVFCSGKNIVFNNQIHTNFKISASGENLYLSSATGILIDEAKVPNLAINQSYARLLDGQSDWSIFINSTPKLPNQSGNAQEVTTGKTVFSLSAGFYTTAQTLVLSCPNPTAVLHYSIDGNDPNLVYTQALNISKSTVVKAVCTLGNNTSEETINSYFIGQQHDIPVVSLSFKPADFFSVDTGIYVLGDTFQTANPNLGANFWQDWRRKVHFEYFVGEKEQIEQDLGVEIHGGWSRAQAMKSLRLYARSDYGKSTLEYPFFDEKPYLTEFKELVLRNGGNDFNQTMWVDALNHRAIGLISAIDRQAYQPVAVYFNGEYMGLHNMRERVGEAYIAENKKIEEKAIDFLELNGGIALATSDLPVTNNIVANQIKTGSNADWVILYDTIINNPMTPELYQYVSQHLDIDLYLDYFAAQIYHINVDWPHNNIRFWKSAQSDNKWRFCYYDTEFGMGIYGSNNTASAFNELNRVINDTRSVHSFMFKKLLDYPAFKNKFVNRSADFMNTIYLPANHKTLAQTIDANIQSEMVQHQVKYGNKTGRDTRVAAVYSFIDTRPNNARNHITAVFANARNAVTLTVIPANAGTIKISTINPQTYPWDGVYYNGVPVQVTAIPNPGYSFKSWSFNNAILTNSSQLLNLTGTNTNLILNLESTNGTQKSVLSEVNYNEQQSFSLSGDWFELYNAGNESIDLSNWVFSDAHPADVFRFAKGTILQAGAYLVVAQDRMAFQSKYPEVQNVIGSFSFGLGNSNDKIQLFDTLGLLRLSFEYSHDTLDAADGKGATLELKSVNSEYQKMVNWQAKCIKGSPGVANHECICDFAVDLGQDLLRCGLISETLQSVSTPSTHDFFWYKDGNLVSIQNQYLATEVNKYRLAVQSDGCVISDEQKIIDTLKIDLGADFTLCNPSFKALDFTFDVQNIAYNSIRNNIQFSDLPLVTINQEGKYKLILSHPDCPDFADSLMVLSNSPLPINDTYCQEDSVAMASVVGEGTYNWYSQAQNGLLLGTGNTLDLEQLSSDTVLYIEDNSYLATTLGIPNSTINFANSAIGTNGMSFVVSKVMSLDAVSVRRNSNQGSTSFILRILNSSNQIVFQSTTSISGTSLTRIPVGIELSPGNYTIDAQGSSAGMSSNLRYENTNLAFPYKINDLISITGTQTGAINRYNFFYKWEVSTGTQGCARVPLFLDQEQCVPTALQEVASKTTNLSIYPNPASHVLYFSDEVATATILDLNGRSIARISEPDLGFDIGNIAQGMYLIELKDSKNEFTVTRLEVLHGL